MSRSNIAGVFTTVKDQAYVDYMIATGTPEAMAKGLLGTHWTLSISFVEGNLVVYFKCEEMPELNLLDTYTEGVEKQLNHALFGGKATMLFTLISPNTYKTTLVTADGKQEWTENYTPDGLIIKAMDGKLIEKYQRKMELDGWYKFVKEENFEEFNKAQGNPQAFVDGCRQMKVGFKFCDKGVKMTEIFGDEEVVNSFKFDQEGEYVLPSMPSLNRKVLVTKTGPGKFLMLTQGPKGKEEWKLTFNAEGMIYEAVDKSTNQCTKIWTQRFQNPFGKYRVLSMSGLEEFGEVMGMPASLINSIATDYVSVMTFSETSGILRATYNSKFMPMDMTYKFDEEFEYTMPGTNDTYKCLESMRGNEITQIMKGARFTTVGLFTFTENFAVMESRIAGTDITYKAVYERL